MIFSGYDNVESIVKLESEDEQKCMFDFVVKMKDAVPDPSSTFGVFQKKPEEIMLLPGLKHTFAKFIENVKKFDKRNRKTNLSIKLGVAKKSKPFFKAKNRSTAKKLKLPTIKEIKDQMLSYMKKQGITKQFTITSSENPSTFLFQCEFCRWCGNVIVNSDGKILLSNVQRHYKQGQCEKKLKKKSNTSSTTLITGYFPSPSLDSRFEPSMDVDGIHFQNSADTTNDEVITPKNLQPPAGIHVNIENSGR